jgi:integrase/recombinase XerD
VKTHATLSALLQGFFTDRLINQCNASPHTIANYRDTFRLLLNYANGSLKKAPTALAIQDVDAGFVCRFLDYLEKEREVTARSRNVRLAAIRSFFNYVALQEPALGGIAQRVLAIRTKRFTKKPVDFLTHAEVEALLAAPQLGCWAGRRDRTLLLVAVQTGLRVSELVGLRCQDVALDTGAHVTCTGKGRKTRCTPLRRESVAALRNWLKERHGQPNEVVFTNARGQPLSRDGVEYLLAKHLEVARRACPSLRAKHVTVHVLRHTCAMQLLQHGVDRSVIALWLGHENMESTQPYLHASLQIKEQALAKTEPFAGQSRRYHPTDQLLAFLQSL